MNIFHEHGNYEVCWQENALWVMPQGAFNEQGALKFNQLIVDTIESAERQDWYRVEVFANKDTMGTPDAESHLVESFSHSKSHGCKMVLMVGGNVCVKHSIAKACRQSNVPIKQFDCLSDVKSFMEARTQNTEACSLI